MQIVHSLAKRWENHECKSAKNSQIAPAVTNILVKKKKKKKPTLFIILPVISYKLNWYFTVPLI